MRIYKNPAMKERAGELRGHMTPQETLLWNYCLKRLPVQIYRQYVIESYIVDFFCRKARLVIEVDGAQQPHREIRHSRHPLLKPRHRAQPQKRGAVHRKYHPGTFAIA